MHKSFDPEYEESMFLRDVGIYPQVVDPEDQRRQKRRGSIWLSDGSNFVVKLPTAGK
jgi:hypothetical protein